MNIIELKFEDEPMNPEDMPESIGFLKGCLLIFIAIVIIAAIVGIMVLFDS